MLEIDHLSIASGAFRLEGVSLAVAAGECHAVLGPSGSGKSTLLRAILGIQPPERGRIRVAGADITEVPLERRDLGYVPQNLGLFPHLSVRENILYGIRARRVPTAEYQPLIERLLSATGLTPLLERYPAALSGGECQRVGLVRALAARPRAVLLDEPFGALNDQLRRELWWLLKALQREFSLTVLLVTHDLAEAYQLADRVTVLFDGRVIQQGSKSEVFTRPVAPDVARFMGVETLHPGRIVEVCDGLATVEVGSARLTAVAPELGCAETLVSIRGVDVALARVSDGRASARNRLPARVLNVRPGSPLYSIELDVGFPLVALVTASAVEELEIRPGEMLTAIIKAPAVHLIPRS